MLSSAPQPQDLEGNSYAVAANDLASFSTYSSFYGCTNGFFLYYDQRFFEGLKGLVTLAVIGNPSTGQSLTLPRLKSKMRNGRTTYLLGYDPISKEFKVLSSAYQWVKNVWISVDCHVLTLGTRRLSWRKVQCCIPHWHSGKCICICGVLYYLTVSGTDVSDPMVVCFDLRTEKFSCVKFVGISSKAKPASQTLVNFDGKLGLLMSENFNCVYGGSKSFELWVLRDAAKHEWSVHVYMLPLLWGDVVTATMCIAGMVGTNEIVLSACKPDVHSYVIYYNVESKTITKVGVQGIEAFQGKYVDIGLNYVENVKLL
ncbi:putative F-box protein At3g23960 [Raphanus sativus]|uniref:F-box protein At3g23960 n=1 Tax=Raphanus sativus TaxID=3726 RepID=A0A6J0NH36_RAPSA|nr:putative F-box protein At3g23960 [Raphanus sativus]